MITDIIYIIYFINKVKGLNQEMYSCNCLPQWYWKKGIHDAIIMQIDVKEFDYDYTEKNPRRNALVFRLDASYAMFDTEIKEIHFINFKNLSGDFYPEKYKESWWIEDELLFDDKKKRWEILVILGNKYNINREIHFAFSHAQVIRK